MTASPKMRRLRSKRRPKKKRRTMLLLLQKPLLPLLRLQLLHHLLVCSSSRVFDSSVSRRLTTMRKRTSLGDPTSASILS